jgi:Fe-S cluster assembly protein SufD
MLTELQQYYEILYQQMITSVDNTELAFVKELRKQGITHFINNGVPTHRLEAWKYTRTQPLQISYPLLSRDPHSETSISPEALAHLQWPDCYQLVFIDGHYCAALSDQTINDQIIATSLAHISHMQPADLTVLHNYFGQLVKCGEPSFNGLNNALWQDGAYIAVKPNTCLDKPLHVLMLSTETAHQHYLPLRLFIHLDQNSQASVIEHHVNLTPSVEVNYFSHTVCEILLDQHATLEHVLIIDENPAALHLATTEVHQEAGSQLSSSSFHFSGRFIRNEINAALLGTQAATQLHGIFIGRDQQHVDNQTLVHHIAANTTSNQLYKGILSDTSRGVFNGKVIVNKEAQNTVAKQYNKNLVLSPRAEMNTRPQLEIYAQEVACSHGATIGTIDQDMLFYLQSRGIDKQAAQELLLVAFAEEGLDILKNASAREYCQLRLAQQLKTLTITEA